MKLSVISFTERGRALSRKLSDLPELSVQRYSKSEGFSEDADGISVCRQKLSDWTGEQFQNQNAIFFIGACGIAVRAIAPFVKDKLSDVPVLAGDEAGRFVIPLLSGHYGGANELAERIAEQLGAVPVLTTATDVNERFAVDVFARKNQLKIRNRDGIKRVSAAVLSGKTVTLAADCPCGGRLPKEVTWAFPDENMPPSILISAREPEGEAPVLQLVPRSVVLGIGCRKGKSLEEIRDAVERVLSRFGILPEAVSELASIDLKKEEAGLCAYASELKIPFRTFSAEELAAAKGDFTPSSFVREVTGIENVCERAAMTACGDGGRLLIGKQAEQGITVAAAEKKWRITFDE